MWDADVERGGKGRLATCGGAFLCVFATKSNQLLMRQELAAISIPKNLKLQVLSSKARNGVLQSRLDGGGRQELSRGMLLVNPILYLA